MTFLWYDSKIFSKYDSKNFLYFSKKDDSKKLIFFESYPKNWTLFTMTLRIEPIFPEWDSENWTPLMWLKDVVLCIWLEKWNSFEYDTKIWTFFECDSKYFFKKTKHWTLWKYDSKNWTLLFDLTHRIETIFSTWLKELNPSFQHDSNNWTLLFKMSQRIEPFLLNTTQRIEPFSFFSNSKNWNFLMTLRTEFFQMWLKKLFFFFFQKKVTRRIKPLKWLTKENFEYDSTNWTFLIWLKELFFWNDSKKLIFLLNVTQRIEFLKMTQIIELFFWVWFKEFFRKKWL